MIGLDRDRDHMIPRGHLRSPSDGYYGKLRRSDLGRGNSWMWSIRTSWRMQKRQRCCRDLTLLNLDTGYRSWTGVGGRPADGDRDMLGISDTCSQPGGRRQQQRKLTRDSGTQEVEELAVLGVHDGSLNELHHRVAAVFKLGVTPQAEGPWRRTGARLVLQQTRPGPGNYTWTRGLDLDLKATLVPPLDRCNCFM